MDWQNNRLYIAAAALLVLGGLAFYLVRQNTGDTQTLPTEAPTLPHIVRDDVTAIDITRPGTDGAAAEHVRLERHDDHWFVTQPIEAPADPSAIDTALEKLTDLEVSGLAASHTEHHAELEVDEGHGVHVVVHGAGDEPIADLIVGAFRSGNTMVRAGGQDTVVTVRGSIRFAFSKDLKDWRDRGMLDLEADHVRVAEWVGPNGTFRFQRPEVAATAEPPAEGEEAPAPSGPTLGDWAPVEVSFIPAVDTDAGVVAPAAPITTIEHYAAARVTSMVSSLAHMRASDFAAAEVTREGAGITDASPRVTLEVVENGTPTRHTITLGNTASEGNFFATRDGDPTIFIISRFLSERVSATPDAFTEAAPAAAPSEDEMPPGMPGGAGGLPPELMEQLQRQLQAQGLGGP